MQVGDAAVTDFVKDSLRWRPLDHLRTRVRTNNTSISDLHFSKSIDVWMYGMTCQEILSGDVPFAEIKTLEDVVKALQGNRLPSLPKASGWIGSDQLELIFDIVKACWKTDPGARPSMTEIVAKWESPPLTVPDLSLLLSEIGDSLRQPLARGGFGTIRQASVRSLSGGSTLVVIKTILYHGEQVDVRNTKVLCATPIITD